MAYSDFSLESVESRFGLTTAIGALFPGLAALPVPPWLVELLARCRSATVPSTDKARSEFLVAPVLMAGCEAVPEPRSIFAGQRFDVDRARGLDGECDFLLARTPPVPRLRLPVVSVTVARRDSIEDTLGQCVAELLAVRLFNERAGTPTPTVFGAVAGGHLWQFLRLSGGAVTLDARKHASSDLGPLLAALREAVLAWMPPGGGGH